MNRRDRRALKREPLYQVNVEETKTGQLRAVGPAMLKEACEQFAHAIRQQIALGREREWSNPQVIRVFTFH